MEDGQWRGVWNGGGKEDGGNVQEGCQGVQLGWKGTKGREAQSIEGGNTATAEEDSFYRMHAGGCRLLHALHNMHGGDHECILQGLCEEFSV